MSVSCKMCSFIVTVTEACDSVVISRNDTAVVFHGFLVEEQSGH